MPLPRNLTSKNKSIHKKTDASNIIKHSTNTLNAISAKHKLGELTFRSCKYSTSDGQVTLLEHGYVSGNMKSGLMIIQITSVSQSSILYDLVEIAQQKKEREEKKKIEEMEKARGELERIKTNADVIEPDANHQAMLNDLMQADATPMTGSSDTIIESEPKAESKPKLKTKTTPGLNTISGNKHFRNFMKDIKNKFSLVEQPSIKYLEIKAETTAMVIENVRAYTITMPVESDKKYMLFIGDLQMKSGLIRQIDPAYKIDNVVKEQQDFLERIRAIEGAKTVELDDNDVISDEDSDNDSGEHEPESS